MNNIRGSENPPALSPGPSGQYTSPGSPSSPKIQIQIATLPLIAALKSALEVAQAEGFPSIDYHRGYLAAVTKVLNLINVQQLLREASKESVTMPQLSVKENLEASAYRNDENRSHFDTAGETCHCGSSESEERGHQVYTPSSTTLSEASTAASVRVARQEKQVDTHNNESDTEYEQNIYDNYQSRHSESRYPYHLWANYKFPQNTRHSSPQVESIETIPEIRKKLSEAVLQAEERKSELEEEMLLEVSALIDRENEQRQLQRSEDDWAGLDPYHGYFNRDA